MITSVVKDKTAENFYIKITKEKKRQFIIDLNMVKEITPTFLKNVLQTFYKRVQV